MAELDPIRFWLCGGWKGGHTHKLDRTTARRRPSAATCSNRSTWTRWWHSCSGDVPSMRTLFNDRPRWSPTSGHGIAHPERGEGSVPARGRRPHGLPAATTCPLNLNRSCQIHLVHKYEEFLSEWRHPAPAHCQNKRVYSRVKNSLSEAVPNDRLGMDVSPSCR